MSSVLAVSYEDIQNVTASDTVNVPGNVAAGFGCDVAGNIAVITLKGTTVTRTCLAGVWYTCAITRIKSTGTTATGLFAIYAQPYRERPSV